MSAMDVLGTYHVGRDCRDKLQSIIDYYEEQEENNTLLTFIRAKIIDALTGVEQPAPSLWNDGGNFTCKFDIDHLCFFCYFRHNLDEFVNKISLQKLLKAVYGVNDASVLAAVLTLTHEEHEALAIKIHEGITDWLVQMRAICVTDKRCGNRI